MLPEICSKCGLLKDLCVCEILDKEETKKIRIYTVKKKFRKFATVIEGIDKQRIKDTAGELKRKLACGGTIKGENIELQGNHERKIVDVLVKMGYPKEVIEVN